MDERPVVSADSILDPRIFFTVTLIVIQLSLLAAIGLAGGGFVLVNAAVLERYGALVRALVWDKHEYWRLLSAMFLHGGLVHFLLNATCLYFFGGPVEIALGRWRYLFLYFAAGLTGNLASLLWGEALGVSVGSSGAIFGIVVTYLMIEIRGPIHWTRVVRQPASRMLFFLIGIQLAMGLLLEQIDSMAHLGGTLTGAMLGYFFVSRMPAAATRASRRWAALGIWIAAFAALVAMASRPATRADRQVLIALHDFTGGDVDGATRHLEAAMAHDPPRAMSALDRMILRYIRPSFRIPVTATLLELSNAETAALDYYRERSRSHSSPDALWLTATLLQKPSVANYDEALAFCAEGGKRFAENRNWDLLEARIHATFRKFDQALAVLDRFQNTSQTRTADYWEIAALCHLRRHECAEVEEATSRCLTAAWADSPAVASDNRDLTIQEWRYRALKEMGREAETKALAAEMEEMWRKAVARSSDDAVALNNLAWHLATHGGDLNEAAQLANRSVERTAQAYNLDTLAWVEHLRGNPKAAWAAMEKSLVGRRSNAPEYLYHAAAILVALGNKTEARHYLERAVAPGIDFDEFEMAEQMLRDLTP